MPAVVSAAREAGLFDLPAPPVPVPEGSAGAQRVQARQTLWRVPVILVSYGDSALITNASDFNQALFDTTGSTPTGSVYDYYQWAARGQLRIIPTVVATVTLPGLRIFYGNFAKGLSRTTTPGNAAGLVTHALQICASSVEWTRFDNDHDGYVDMLWVVHAGRGGEGTGDPNDLWSITSRLSLGWTNSDRFDATAPGGPRMLIDRFTVLPELSLFASRRISEIGVYCHEMGHALGLPDLYDTAYDPSSPRGFNRGPGNWSLMSTGAYGGDGNSPQSPSHPGAWCSLFLGWNQCFRPAQDTLVTLSPLVRGGQVLELWFQGQSNPEHFLVECRKREGFDRALPAEGLLVYHVNELEIGLRLGSNQVNSGPEPALVVVEADGRGDLTSGRDPGDSTDTFPGGLHRTSIVDDVAQPSTATFRGVPTNIALLEIAPQDDGVRVRAQVRAAGWLPATDRGDPDYSPVTGFGAAATAAVDRLGALSSVSSEMRGGHAQIILRAREGESWQPPFQVSQSSGSALDPSIALLPGGDLAVAWSDRRAGHTRIYYRARVRGQWTVEQPIADLPGESVTPTIGADARGTVQVAWTYLAGARPQILLQRFTYLSPFGQAIPVTGTLNMPGTPGLAVAPDGGSYVVWSDQASSPQALRYAHFDPASGLAPEQRLTQAASGIQQAGHSIMDAAGTLHTVWIVSGPALNEIHYQRRPASGTPSPADTTLEIDGGIVQAPRLAADPAGGLHLVYQSLSARVNQIRYKRWRPDRGWDLRSTEITLPDWGNTQQAAVAPSSPGRVSILYTGYPDGLPHLMERRRLTDLPGALAAAPPPLVVTRLALGPNPLRAGQSLRMSWTGIPAESGAVVDFFDVSGRVLATVPLVKSASGADPFTRGAAGFGGALGPAATGGWPSGVYFGHVRGSRQAAARLVFLR